ncbi:MAG TPA: hypothetical protein VK995_01115 [Oceanipulchritudo sp.]|nr:hypothetical protein [Oceanipulchritudo sp.]
MDLVKLAILGGVWLSLLYSAAVMPASVWVIQLTVSRGWLSGMASALGLSAGQIPWCLAASLLLFQMAPLWQTADLWLRAVAVVFLVWMAIRSARAKPVQVLRLQVQGSDWALFKASFWRSLVMPWRLPLWASLIISISVHLRGPGPLAAGLFAVGCLLGQMAWHLHFIIISGLFGHRVPEDISLHSMNKFRLLATMVVGGLVLVIVAPIAFPPV